MAKRMTQKAIGKALGVSYITVQRALNDSGYVSKRLKSRILNYANKVNYSPHKAAQSLVRKKTRTIALYSSDFPKYFWSDVRSGAMIARQQIAPFNYEVYYHFIPAGDSKAYVRQLRADIDAGVDAVSLVNQVFFDMPAIFNVLEESGTPYMMLSVDAPETDRLFFVGPDYPAGGRIAADLILRMLKNLNEPRIGVILNSSPYTVVPAANVMMQRLKGFQEIICKSSAQVDLVTKSIPLSEASQRIEMEIDGFLASHDDLSALYLIASYNEILERVMARQHKRGKLVTVVHDLDPRTEVSLESDVITAVIYQNPILQGYYAVKLLEHFLETGKAMEPKTINIVHSIIMRENKDLSKNHYLFAAILGELGT